MPYEWTDLNTGAPVSTGALFVAPTGEGGVTDRALRLTAWPHRSLSNRGFVTFIGATALLFLFPLLALIGHSLLWVLLPFPLLALVMIWWFIARNTREGTTVEVLDISAKQAVLIHKKPGKTSQTWQANPYWITVTLHRNQGPIPKYLTLRGRNSREVELGAFLTEDERAALAPELRAVFGSAGHATHP